MIETPEGFISDEQMVALEQDNVPDFISDEEMAGLEGETVPIGDTPQEPLGISRPTGTDFVGQQRTDKTEGLFEGFEAGMNQPVHGEVAYDILENGSTPHKEKLAFDLSLKNPTKTEGILAPFGVIAGQMYQQTITALPKAMIGGVATGTVAALSGVATITTPAAFGAGFTTMLASDTAAQIYRQEAGNSYLELRDIVDKDTGKKINDGLARGMAYAVGSINMGLEGASFGVLLTPFKKAARAMLRKKATDIAMDATKRKILQESFKRGGIALVVENFTEFLQETTGIAAEKTGGKEFKEGEVAERFGGVASEVTRGMIPFAVLAGGANYMGSSSRTSKKNKAIARKMLKKEGATDQEVSQVLDEGLIPDEQLIPMLAEKEQEIAIKTQHRNNVLNEATEANNKGEPITVEQGQVIDEVHEEMIEEGTLKQKDNILLVEQKLDRINEIMIGKTATHGKILSIAKKKGEINKALKRKAVKPTIHSGRKKARFDYETNKDIQELSRINNLKQEEADTEFSKLGEPKTEIDKIKTRLMAMRVLEDSATPELVNQVYEDVLRIKQIGKEAKNEIEFQLKLERAEMAQTLVDRGEAIKGDKKTLKTKIGNAYRRGVADMRSGLASMFGTEVAEHYDMAQVEQDKRVAVQDKRQEIDDAIVEIYGEKEARVIKGMMKDKDYVLVKANGKTKTINKLELIDIYNSIKNPHSRKMYNKAYTNIDELVGDESSNLTSNDKKFGDFLQQQVQGYREVLNKKNIEDTGVDLGFIENYWPRKSETQQDLLNYFKVQSNVASAQKLRETQGKVVPVPQNAYLNAIRHIEQAEWIDKVSRKYDENNRDFNAPDVKDMIIEKYGEGVHKSMMDTLERNSLVANNKQVDFGFNFFNFMVNNWVVSNVAFNPTVIARQLGSVTNYAQHMSPAKWAINFNLGLATPKKTFNYMWQNSEYLRKRWKMGNSDATERALRDAEKLSSWWGSFNNVLTSGSRATDIGAQIYGGYPLIKEFEKTMSTEQAFKKFEKISRREQQSGLQANLSNIQSNPMARWMFAFKNTPTQYARLKVDAIYRYQNGEITKAELAKVLVLIGVVQPIMYSLMGGLIVAGMKAAGGEDEAELMEDIVKDTAVNLMSNTLNFIPLVDGATKTVARSMVGEKSFKPLGMPVIDDYNAVFSKLGKDDKTMEDWFVITTMLQEPVFPLPTGTAKRYYDYLAGDKKSKSTVTDN